jgi:hypothetical protein
MKDELIISKVDASKRQLETAIQLYFHDGEPVSIHTLVAAAYNVLRDLNKTRSGTPMFVKDHLQSYLKSEFASDFKKMVNEAENFFKHADHDPEKVLTFRPSLTEMLLFDACQKYRDLTTETTAILTLFTFWHIIQNPQGFIIPSEAQSIVESISSRYGIHERQRFFAEVLPKLYRQSVS